MHLMIVHVECRGSGDADDRLARVQLKEPLADALLGAGRSRHHAAHRRDEELIVVELVLAAQLLVDVDQRLLLIEHFARSLLGQARAVRRRLAEEVGARRLRLILHFVQTKLKRQALNNPVSSLSLSR